MITVRTEDWLAALDDARQTDGFDTSDSLASAAEWNSANWGPSIGDDDD